MRFGQRVLSAQISGLASHEQGTKLHYMRLAYVMVCHEGRGTSSSNCDLRNNSVSDLPQQTPHRHLPYLGVLLWLDLLVARSIKDMFA